MAALECGIPWATARSMRFTELTVAVRAHNDMHAGGDDRKNETPDGRRVRDATPADIKAFLG